MKLAQSLITASALSLIMLGNAAGSTDAPRNLAPLFGEFVATNPGLEVAVPLFNFTDTVAPIGYPESFSISYKVYSLGTYTLLYTTPSKGFLTPAIPAGCTDPNTFNLDWNVLFTRRGAQLNSVALPVADGTRIHLGVNMEFECYDGVAQSWTRMDRALVYSANLSGVAETGNPVASWSKTFVDQDILGLNGIDTDGNLVTDKLTITTVSGPEYSANAVVLVVTGGTGAVETANAYPLIR